MATGMHKNIGGLSKYINMFASPAMQRQMRNKLTRNQAYSNSYAAYKQYYSAAEGYNTLQRDTNNIR